MDRRLRKLVARLDASASPIREARAGQLAQAIAETYDRHVRGLMSAPTFKAHRDHLWAKATDEGVALHVLAIIEGPAAIDTPAGSTATIVDDRKDGE